MTRPPDALSSSSSSLPPTAPIPSIPPPSQAKPIPMITKETLTTASEALAPALHLLERFHHRNRNQHRPCRWWAQADMLRRGVSKMLGEVEGLIRIMEEEEKRREMVGKIGKGKGKGKKGDGAKGGGDRGEKGVGVRGEDEGDNNGVVAKRAEYLRWKLGPGAYVAFSQLAADRQFAHLGLMLLGVLAQVDRALAPFAPSPPPGCVGDGDWMIGNASGVAEMIPATLLTTTAKSLTLPERRLPRRMDADMNMAMATDTDLGVPVSRDEIFLSSTTKPELLDNGTLVETSASTPIPTSSASLLSSSSAQPKRAESLPAVESTQPQSNLNKPNKPRVTTTAASTNTEHPELKHKPTNESSHEPEPDPKPKVKKKKKAAAAGGDEFDDIFGGLDNDDDRPKKKKKKWKKADEFDDIFGGL
ncbi:hypothetical protein VTJ49DRAFT_2166 [Mycothermus thermophilus]|uniref:RNase MRP protein 1 RNA binding domain-containing protein n=1 Tax=Humicola insolens TaxID=85995 RepID=A0ABR3VAU9_HUMIN